MRPALLLCLIQAAVSEIQPCYYYKLLIIILHDYYIIFSRLLSQNYLRMHNNTRVCPLIETVLSLHFFFLFRS